MDPYLLHISSIVDPFAPRSGATGRNGPCWWCWLAGQSKPRGSRCGARETLADPKSYQGWSEHRVRRAPLNLMVSHHFLQNCSSDPFCVAHPTREPRSLQEMRFWSAGPMAAGTVATSVPCRTSGTLAERRRSAWPGIHRLRNGRQSVWQSML